MQDYRVPTENKTDKARRGLWVAFILSATVSIILAFCSREKEEQTYQPGEYSPISTDVIVSATDGVEPTLDDSMLLQVNAERPGYKELDLDQIIYFLLTGLDKWEIGGDSGRYPAPGYCDPRGTHPQY